MGFGIVFIGLTLILTMTAYGVLPAFIGYFVCAYGCKKLCDYEEKFKLPRTVMMIAGMLGIVDMILAIVGYFGKDQTVLSVSGGFGLAMDLVLFACALTLLSALRKIADDTGREKTVMGCNVSAAVLTVCLIIELVAVLLVIFGVSNPITAVLSWYTLIIPFAVLGVLIVLTFSCYMWICPEGEEEMEKETALNRRITSAFRKTEQNDGNSERPTNKKKKKRK